MFAQTGQFFQLPFLLKGAENQLVVPPLSANVMCTHLLAQEIISPTEPKSSFNSEFLASACFDLTKKSRNHYSSFMTFPLCQLAIVKEALPKLVAIELLSSNC